MPNQLAITLHSATTPEIASGIGLSVDLGARTLLELTLDVSVMTGTSPALAVVVEHSQTTADWALVGTFIAFAGIGAKNLVIPNARRYVRVSWTIAGTLPSITFAVTGVAHQLYTETSDLTQYGIPEIALEGVSAVDRALACLAASDEAAGYLASAFTLPMVAWDRDLRMHGANMAVYTLIRPRGYDPDSGQDTLIRDGYDRALKWLDRIAAGKLRPPGMIDSTPEITEPEVWVVSQASRGWGR